MPARLTRGTLLAALVALAAALGATYAARASGDSDAPARRPPLGSLAVPLDLTAAKGPPLSLGAVRSLPALARPRRPE
ncbi:MAG: hypothetical protein ACRDL0_10220, partial [Thermoleophilaceae bacterium]